MFILQQDFGNDGYAFWFKLLELLGASEGHFIDFSVIPTRKYLQAITLTNDKTCLDILNLLATLDAIDSNLWKQGIIWSDNFVAGLSVLYRNRNATLPEKPKYTQETRLTGIIVTINPQLDKIRVDKKELKIKDLSIAMSIDRPDGFGEHQPNGEQHPEKPEEPTGEQHPGEQPEKVGEQQPDPGEQDPGKRPGEQKPKRVRKPKEPGEQQPRKITLSKVVEIWNEKAPPELARVAVPFKRTPKKLVPISAMIALYPEQSFWEQLIAKIYQSSFLRGKNGRGWKATFDFIVSKADEINDGKYLDAGGANQTEQTINTAYNWAKKREAQRDTL